MTANSREEASKTKQEDDAAGGLKFLKPSNSRQWSGFRNPRIVRVSRTFGGKDRHSKVCTIRGLRDRRIRLAVPTAIQLYDLQDRLGLGQPSKVIDWLLEATKLDIDNLPPLQIPQGFDQFHPHSMGLAHESSASQPFLTHPSFFDATSVFNTKDGVDHGGHAKSKYWDLGFLSRDKNKEEDDRGGSKSDKGKCAKSTEELENQEGHGGYFNQLSAQNFFSVTSQSLPVGLLNNAITYSSYPPVDPSSLSLSQFGSSGTISSQIETINGNVMSFPTPVQSAGSHSFVRPSASPTVFASYPPYINPSVDSDPRLFNHIQLLSSSSQVLSNSLTPSTNTNSSLRPFPTQLGTKLLGSDISEPKPTE